MMPAYLEYFMERHPGLKYLFTEDDNAKAHNRLESKYAKHLREEIWRKPEFIDLGPEAGPVDSNGWPTDIGTHSSCKCPAKYDALFVVQSTLRSKYVAA
jgi:hypothetical protein